MKKIAIVCMFVLLLMVSTSLVAAGSQARQSKSTQEHTQTKMTAMEQLTFHWRTHTQDMARIKDQIQNQLQNFI